MARSNMYSIQASPISTTKKQESRSSGTPTLSGISPHSTLNASNIKKQWSRSRNDTPLLVRSSVKCNDSNDSLTSSSASETSSPPEGGGRCSMSSDAATSDQMPCKQPWASGPRQLAGASTLNTSSKGTSKKDGSGIYMNAEKEKHQSDSLASLDVRQQAPAFHGRSTTGTSQHSTISSSQNVHPTRPVQGTYIPKSQSYQTSLVESDDSESSVGGDPQPSVQAPRLSLQINDGSFTPLPGISQTNVTGRSSFGYTRDSGSALDTPSPIPRSSFDFVFRSKARTSVDPMSRAATVQAARQAFEQKEEAKTRKFEQQQMKAEEKQTRRKEKQHWRVSMRDDDEIHCSTPVEISEKPDTTGTAETPHATPSPPQVQPQPQPPSASASAPTSCKARSRNTWMLFIIWLRTRVFKLRRRIRQPH